MLRRRTTASDTFVGVTSGFTIMLLNGFPVSLAKIGFVASVTTGQSVLPINALCARMQIDKCF